MADTTSTKAGALDRDSPEATQAPPLRERDYSAGHIANYILDLADRDGVAVTPMKLQKLVYIAFGWALALYHLRLFRERIQAWEHGPVIPSLYHEFKVYTDSPITGRSFDLNHDGSTSVASIPRSDRAVRKAISGIWRAYGRLSAGNLRNRTHAPGTPWDQVYNGQATPGGEIAVERIRKHFVTKREQFLGW